MAFTGSIKGWTITEMLQLIRTMRKSGAMIVQTSSDYGEVKKVVYFRNGMVIAVDTGGEDLGAILLEENFITRSDLDEAIRLQKTNFKGKRIEQILAAMKKVDVQRLVRAIRIQIERVITNLLQEKNAKVSFDPDAPLRVQALSNGIDVQNILLNASVKVDELKLVREKISSTSLVPKRTKRGDDNLKEIALKLDEWKVFLAIDGKTDVRTIIMKLKMDEVQVLKAISFFIEEKWVEVPKIEQDTRKKILIVDDSAVIRKSIEMALAETGYGLISAATGEAAIKLATEQKPDLILLDVMLPDTTGLKVCKTLRSEYEDLKTTPIVMLSAKDAEIDKNLGLHAGANDYVTKPFKDGQLVEIVDKFLKN
ncbi:response regulator receiver protein [Chloroherpeton thalassium ATCC 35110]|uniref:Response regulator receiver protein n=1 Tax=Chloroherpeton thalassium (strain ATCC 35110 / GB-78) TaxID=517418 RepID=B3QXJ2_CHLT3|nr:response regulator [Chloroherpeton thalassium]ACF14907.1 response regulator receiver protein [Chloroherpeton thalassium ATCC 35110]